MKKAILVVLMVVMIATPCLAQEIEPDGIFTIEGTEWKMLPIEVQISPFPFIYYNNQDSINIGFYGGKVYLDLELHDNSFYLDMLVFSIFGGNNNLPNSVNSISTHQSETGGTILYFGILQPIGIGTLFGTSFSGGAIPLPLIRIALLIKTNDNWTPSEVE